jgi:hypothetical protein
MKPKRFPWFRVAVGIAQLLVLVAAAAFPLVITETVLAGLLKTLELIGRLP